MADIAITQEQKDEINQAQAYLNGAKNYIVNDVDSFIRASNLLKEIKTKKKTYDEMRKTLKAPINKAAKAIEDFFRQPINFLTQAESAYKVTLKKYEEVEQHKQQAAEKLYLKKLHELSNEAVDALSDNKFDEYNDMMVEVAELDLPTSAIPENSGMSFRDNWKGRVVDIDELLHAIFIKKAPGNLIKLDESALNQLAKSTKGIISIPGVEFYNDRIIAVKTD
jgi:hypothetical protein